MKGKNEIVATVEVLVLPSKSQSGLTGKLVSFLASGLVSPFLTDGQ